MLTYPLACPVDEGLLGIDYIMEYLRRLILENNFVGCFEPQAVKGLLRSISPTYREDLLSIYEAVTANAVALTLLGDDALALDVTDRDRERLVFLFSRWTDADAPERLRGAARELRAALELREANNLGCTEEMPADKSSGEPPDAAPEDTAEAGSTVADKRTVNAEAGERTGTMGTVADSSKRAEPAASDAAEAGDAGASKAAEYLADTAAALWPRIKACQPDGLKNVFPPLYRETAARKPAPRFIDNAVMDNAVLRALIDEVTACRHLSDKLALVKAQVKSVRDLMEILNTCFWGEEINALFDALGPEACRVLVNAVRERQRRFPDWRSETGWETRLFEYHHEQS
jgi:hypothetical protein